MRRFFSSGHNGNHSVRRRVPFMFSVVGITFNVAICWYLVTKIQDKATNLSRTFSNLPEEVKAMVDDAGFVDEVEKR